MLLFAFFVQPLLELLFAICLLFTAPNPVTIWIFALNCWVEFGKALFVIPAQNVLDVVGIIAT